MNKAFVREPDQTADYCPRCGSKGEPVGGETLGAFLTDVQRQAVAEAASFCPSPKCPVVYFDTFERTILAADIERPVYPKDTTAPICGCFGLTREDIARDVREGVATRTKAVLEKAGSPGTPCRTMAANGKPCTAYVQKYYLECARAQEVGAGSRHAGKGSTDP